MRSAHHARQSANRLLWWMKGLLLACAGVVNVESANPTIQSLAELQDIAATNYQVITSFALTGLVCSADAESHLVALQDDSGTALLELPHLDHRVHPGDRLALECTRVTVSRSAGAVLVGTGPTVEIDALHPPLSRSGRVFLATGLQPIRLEWFNGQSSGYLDVRYEGPNLPLQRIPDAALLYRVGENVLRPGLHFAAYQGPEWTVLPDLQLLVPFASGDVANFDVSQYSQQSPVAVRFSGYLQVSNAGVYTFNVTSDDGARLFVGDPASQCTTRTVGRPSPPPVAKSLTQVLAERSNQEWVSLEGSVTFASRRGNQIDLEVVGGDLPVSVLIVNTASLATTNLPGQRIKVTGICQWPYGARTPRLIVPGVSQFKALSGSHTAQGTDKVITVATRVRSLQPDEARRGIHARIRGVVTTATPRSCVVQDSSGPVFVRPGNGVWPDQPHVGERWEFEGTTDPGEFSPIIFSTNALCLGRGTLPPPIHPSWEQLLNGSLDVELVELPGIVLETTPSEMTLLTHGGEVSIVGHYEYPLPYPTALIETNQALEGSLVHVRGVLFALRDLAGQLVPGRILLGDPMISIEKAAPANPFALPTQHVSDLLRFTSHADELTRFKLTGQMLYATPRECFLMDGSNGFRIHTKESLQLAEGDLVEAVGFPQLGGASPSLIEAVARKIGRAKRPEARALSETELSDEGNDSTVVSLEAMLLSDAVRLGERVLELQADGQHFIARLRTPDRPAKLLRAGSQLQLTGIYASTRGGAGTSPGTFELLLNGASDIVVLRPGPWWTKRHTIVSIAILLIGLTASLAWVALLHRTVAHRTALLETEIHQREQSEQRRLLEQERARVAQDLHDELGAGLAQISLIGSLAQRPTTQADRARGLLSLITNRSREMVSALDEIVWAVNPKHDTTASVTGYLTDYAQEFFHPTSIVCRLDTPSEQPEQAMNSRLRHQLFLAFKEALTNVVKHAEATEVCVRIHTSEGGLRIIVEDNGKGISLPMVETCGEGTTNMRKRLDQIGGSCEIKQRSNGGTIVSFSLPVNK